MVRVDGKGNGDALVRARSLDKKYLRGSEEIHVLQGLNLDVDKGEFVAFMGPSGSGKTTLLNLLGGLDLPTSGSITVAGAPCRLYLPDVQPDTGSDRLPERGAAPPPHETLEK